MVPYDHGPTLGLCVLMCLGEVFFYTEMPPKSLLVLLLDRLILFGVVSVFFFCVCCLCCLEHAWNHTL